MVNGLYTASASMIQLQKKQDVIANNLANSNTTGFKVGRLLTSTEITIGRNAEGLLHQDEDQNLNEVYISHEKGPLVQTDNAFDFALEGDGFFTIETEEGTRYSRSGAFTIDNEGFLTTLGGDRVLMDNGDNIDIGNQSLSIMGDGGIYLDGNKTGNLGVATFDSLATLLPRGKNLFENINPQDNPPQEETSFRVKQGFLEGSNVNAVAQMVEMIAKFRNYEASQKSMQAIDDTLTKAVNEVGRVQ